MIPDTPEQLHLKEASELQSNVSGSDSGCHKTLHPDKHTVAGLYTTIVKLKRARWEGRSYVFLIISVAE